MNYFVITTVLVLIGVFIMLFLLFKRRKTEVIITREFKEIIDLLEKTKTNLFISGKAGTGKSTLLRYFTEITNKNHVVLAPTGVAALNVRGQTIHSFFRFPPKLLTPDDIKTDYVRASLFNNLDMVIIDEVSMVRADLMNAIDLALRSNRGFKDVPFGGVQMVFIGDLFQLPPVVTNDLTNYFEGKYGGQYFFNAPVFSRGFDYEFKELTYIFRQEDREFKEFLNRVRVNESTRQDLILLNSRHIDNAGIPLQKSIILTTINRIARNKNREKLDGLTEREYTYNARLTGDLLNDYTRIYENYANNQITEDGFEDKIDNTFPAPPILKLKKGAQIMMTKNDSGKRWVNGSIGTVNKLDATSLWVKIEGRVFKVEKEEWEKLSYTYDNSSGAIRVKNMGTFIQYPVKLAWAITIHKSQGKTFDSIIIDVGRGAFAHGQIYVALSRCRQLTRIFLINQISDKDVIVDEKVVNFYNELLRDKNKES